MGRPKKKANLHSLKCAQCKTPIVKNDNEFHRSEKHFCSRSCVATFYDKALNKVEKLQQRTYNKICQVCKVSFETHSSHQKFCAELCAWKHYNEEKKKRGYKSPNPRKRSLIDKQCEECGTKFQSKYKKVKFCSRKCVIIVQVRNRTKFLDIPDYLDDASRKIDKKNGYVYVYALKHPKSNSWGYVAEHRLIAEQMIGR